MNIRLVFFGKNKPVSLDQSVQELVKQLKPYCQLEIVYLKDQKVHDDVPKVLEKEAEVLEKHLSENEFFVLCDEKGDSFSSVQLASQFEKWKDTGRSNITIAVGSAHGFAPRIKEKADFLLSLSPLTMNHQIVRLVLLEQLYRIFTIQRGMKYHK